MGMISWISYRAWAHTFISAPRKEPYTGGLTQLGDLRTQPYPS